MDDGETLPLSCPKCHHTTGKTVAWVRENTFYTCAHCATSVLIDKDAATTLLAALQRNAD
jgi:DNA-directed RNA polymerase subunit RPC12/RpoP